MDRDRENANPESIALAQHARAHWLYSHCRPAAACAATPCSAGNGVHSPVDRCQVASQICGPNYDSRVDARA
jgi:hypothetical protein